MDELNNRRHLKDARRELRTRGTAAEGALWKLLQRRQVEGRRFRRQHSFGPYILDFYCPAEQLAVELDGAVHADPGQAEYDEARDTYLREHGIEVLRFENKMVFEDPEGTLAAIRERFSEEGGADSSEE